MIVADALYASPALDITTQVLTALQSRPKTRPGAREALTRRRIPQVRLAELAVRFGCELRGDPEAEVDHVATLQDATAGSLAFLANPRYGRHLAATARPRWSWDASLADRAPCRGAGSSESLRHLRTDSDPAASARSLHHRCAHGSSRRAWCCHRSQCLDRRRLLRRGRGAHAARAF